MRRSKSDPAKYARNYRKISQRRMTQYDGLDEEKEIKRLRSILKSSEKQLKGISDSSSLTGDGNKKKRKPQSLNEDVADENLEMSIFSKEFLDEQGHGEFGTDNNPLIVLPKKKKKKKARIQLTPEEIKEAKILRKKTAKKLQQLEARAVQKKKRAELYKKLQQDQESQIALQPLLLASGKLSRKESETKKQAVKKIFNKEKAGLVLTREEKELLYPERMVVDELPSSHSNNATMFLKSPEETSVGSETIAKSDHKIKQKGRQLKEEDTQENDAKKATHSVVKHVSHSKNTSDKDKKVETNSTPAVDFAAQMLASLSKLKDNAKENKQICEEPKNESNTNTEKQPKNVYIPSNPTILKTAATLGLKNSENSDTKREVVHVQRPIDVEKSRYDLPVTAMEFEIMDAIRNNDVTIICGETGSGKSTQIPAYIYEGGMCHSPNDQTKSYMVGVTQPRRVAAVSTAKRICYELGQGDGQSIKGSGRNGNLVAYKTRYESAGCGDSTRIQFMTDGILLSEIQSDLLLRRYSVIVLDESHERNLNTDVLIGLISVALPLRKKAAQEDPSIPPLKLVLMSATLRVEDFTKNKKLFPNISPKIVTVPGRTHPVTIHHSKVTELDDYGKCMTNFHVEFLLHLYITSLNTYFM